jgi:hypothetical protein
MRTIHRIILSSLVLAAGLGATVTAPRAAHARQGDASNDFGMGLMLGTPTGLSMKYYFGRSSGGSVMALQAGLGVVENFGDDGLHLHVDVLWHPAVLARTADFTLPFYVGVGGRLLEHDEGWCWVGNDRVYCYDDDTHIGLRAPVGLLMDFTKVNLDVFFEVALVADLIYIENDDIYEHDHDHLHLNGAIGVRYYF